MKLKDHIEMQMNKVEVNDSSVKYYTSGLIIGLLLGFIIGIITGLIIG